MFIWHVCAKTTRRQPFHGPKTAVLVCEKDGASRDEHVLVEYHAAGWTMDGLLIRESRCAAA
jgi:hypothetical protein